MTFKTGNKDGTIRHHNCIKNVISADNISEINSVFDESSSSATF